MLAERKCSVSLPYSFTEGAGIAHTVMLLHLSFVFPGLPFYTLCKKDDVCFLFLIATHFRVPVLQDGGQGQGTVLVIQPRNQAVLHMWTIMICV